MPDIETIQRILGVAIHAPSGDNAQPWRFAIKGNVVEIYNLEDRDATLYNFRQRGSYFAHGALAENLVIAASKEGYATHIEPFPGDSTCTARITLLAGEPQVDPLYAAISRRMTNRKPYSHRRLEGTDRNMLERSMPVGAHLKLKLIEDPVAISMLARAISVNERLLMENRYLHDFLFGMIRWTTEEERHETGLYVMTMEFSALVRFMMRYVLRHWLLVRVLNTVGLSRLIPKQSAEVYAASSALCTVVITRMCNIDFFDAGRAFERLWLTATDRSLSIQPVTALPYLMQRVNENEAGAFSAEHVELIRTANVTIKRAFALTQNENIAMLFRIGYCGEPTARSAKRPPVIVS